MSRQVFCEHFQKELEGLDRPPYPGGLGEKIYQSVSKQAWNTWIEHQTMLINENQLSMLNPKARKYLQEEMTKFLFGKGSEKPSEYVPPDIKWFFMVLFPLFYKMNRRKGQIAQLVEQRTENPRVGGSIPPLATTPAKD